MKIAYALIVSAILGYLFSTAVVLLGPEIVGQWIEQMVGMHDNTWFAVVALLCVVCFSTIILAPTSVVIMSGAFVYGIWFYLPSVFASLAGAFIGYWLGRRLHEPKEIEVEGANQRQLGRLQRILGLVHSKPFLATVLMRFFPVVPFMMQNLFLGSQRIPFRTYFIASIFAISITNATLCMGGILSRNIVDKVLEFAPAGYVLSTIGLCIALAMIRINKNQVVDTP